MKLYLLKAFHFQKHDQLPYRSDGRGGNVFHGVGSHVLYSDLKERWYRFAFEVATEGQPEEALLVETRLLATVEGKTNSPQQSILEWRTKSDNPPVDYRRPTLSQNYVSYQWKQYLQIDVTEPELITISVEMKFSHSEKWLTVDGVTRVLADLHPEEPPRHYSKPIWHLRRWLGKKD